jgi:hypothetical protein
MYDPQGGALPSAQTTRWGWPLLAKSLGVRIYEQKQQALRIAAAGNGLSRDDRERQRQTARLFLAAGALDMPDLPALQKQIDGSDRAYDRDRAFKRGRQKPRHVAQTLPLSMPVFIMDYYRFFHQMAACLLGGNCKLQRPRFSAPKPHG